VNQPQTEMLGASAFGPPSGRAKSLQTILRGERFEQTGQRAAATRITPKTIQSAASQPETTHGRHANI
jgi:hypothetical protein